MIGLSVACRLCCRICTVRDVYCTVLSIGYELQGLYDSEIETLRGLHEIPNYQMSFSVHRFFTSSPDPPQHHLAISFSFRLPSLVVGRAVCWIILVSGTQRIPPVGLNVAAGFDVGNAC